MIKFHPSTSTNKSSLKGRDIITGGSIIMPMLKSILATTISTIRKGRKSRKPISNAVFSSLIAKAGIKTLIDRSSGVSGAGFFVRPENNTISFCLVCFSINSFNGGTASSTASPKFRSSEIYGVTALSLITLIVGDIIKNVKNSESPIITGFGGICCPPNACRKNDSTTTIRVNEVTIISTAGKKERKLMRRKTSMRGLFISLKSIACAGDVTARSKNKIAVDVTISNLQVLFFNFYVLLCS
jgi:hypothetical protein